MINLTFKDVGQGDSLLLEWNQPDGRHIGIIDCAKKGKINPVLEHIIVQDFNHIDFIILTHPHDDHFSGFSELFKYCFEKSISIGWFGQTLHHLGPKYWRLFETSHSALQELEKIFDFVQKLKKSSLLSSIKNIVEDWKINITDGLSLCALSPAHDEIDEYYRRVKLDPSTNIKMASQAANLLSTVLKLNINDTLVLLTSDAEFATFDRFLNNLILRHENIFIAQAPHHGSSKNFCDEFWSNLPIIPERKIVVSAGHNNKYRHPHLTVLERFNVLGFKVHSTNVVHGMREFIDLRRLTISLDEISDLLDINSGDKSFSF